MTESVEVTLLTTWWLPMPKPPTPFYFNAHAAAGHCAQPVSLSPKKSTGPTSKLPVCARNHTRKQRLGGFHRRCEVIFSYSHHPHFWIRGQCSAAGAGGVISVCKKVSNCSISPNSTVLPVCIHCADARQPPSALLCQKRIKYER